MVFHPPGIVVEIVGTEADDQGCLCEEHTLNCSKVLEPEVVVRLWKVQVMVEGREEKAIAVVWVNDEINRCHVASSLITWSSMLRIVTGRWCR
jgi:hypothetical protein